MVDLVYSYDIDIDIDIGHIDCSPCLFISVIKRIPYYNN